MSAPQEKRRRVLKEDGPRPLSSVLTLPSAQVLLSMDTLKDVCPYLAGDIRTLNRLSEVCTELRDFVWGNDNLWTDLLIRRYPNLRDLSTEIQSDRDGFIRRLNLHRDEYAPVRSVGLPRQLQRKTPGKILFDRWKPDVFVFLVDIWRGSTQILSHSFSIRLKDPQRKNIDDMIFYGTMDSSLAHAAIEKVFDEIRESTHVFHPIDLYVSVALAIEGASVPRCEPIVLLSEHASFAVLNPIVSGDDTVSDGVDFRTDVDECWQKFPDFSRGDRTYADESSETSRQILNRCRKHQSKYSVVPLPFDPCVQICISPRGTLKKYFDNDSTDQFALQLMLNFTIGDRDELDFNGEVMPTLLSLWNDAARNQGKRR